MCGNKNMMEKNSYPCGSAIDTKNADADADEWEMRPSGMFVQKRKDENGGDVSSSSPTIAVSVTHGHGPTKYKIFLSAQSTFGDMKKHLVAKTGLQPERQRLLFRGKEKDDNEHLHTAGVKNLSKILLLEDHTRKQRKVVLNFKVVEEVKKSDEVSKALKEIAEVQSEVDKLSDRVAALEVAVNGGTVVADKEFLVSTELLMRQLLKLDSIDAEGEARMLRKAEVRRVQNSVDIIDALKARLAHPISNNPNTISVATEWETFDSGVGSLTPPFPAPSTRETQDWERFD